AELEASLPEELLRIEQPPMADYLEAFVPMRLHVLIRFGMWEDILALPLPADPRLYCTTTAMTHYAQGVAYAATGRMAEAAGGGEARGDAAHAPGTEGRGVPPPRGGDLGPQAPAVQRAVGLDAAYAARS